MKAMEDRSGGMYRGSAGSIYPALQQLEDEGLIEGCRQEGRRVYQLTEAGRKELEKEPEAVRRIWERAERWEECGDRAWGRKLWRAIRAAGRDHESRMRRLQPCGRQTQSEQKLLEILERARRELEKL